MKIQEMDGLILKELDLNLFNDKKYNKTKLLAY